MCLSLWAARLRGFLPKVPGALAELRKAVLIPACRDFYCHRPLFSHSHCIYKLQNWTFSAWPPHALSSCFLVLLHMVVAILSWVVSLHKPGHRRQSVVLHRAGSEIKTAWKGASVSGKVLLQRVQELLWYTLLLECFILVVFALGNSSQNIYMVVDRSKLCRKEISFANQGSQGICKFCHWENTGSLVFLISVF